MGFHSGPLGFWVLSLRCGAWRILEHSWRILGTIPRTLDACCPCPWLASVKSRKHALGMCARELFRELLSMSQIEGVKPLGGEEFEMWRFGAYNQKRPKTRKHETHKFHANTSRLSV